MSDVVTLFNRYARARGALTMHQLLGVRLDPPEGMPADFDELDCAVLREQLRAAWIEAHPPPDDEDDEPPDPEPPDGAGWTLAFAAHDVDGMLAYLDQHATDMAHATAVSVLRTLASWGTP
jgi:hypothetical protein